MSSSPLDAAASASAATAAVHRFELFLGPESPASRAARVNVDAALRGIAGLRYELVVIDVTRDPERAERAAIVATPTLVRRAPLPEHRLIGDFADRDAVTRTLTPDGKPMPMPGSGELFEALLRDSPDGMLILDADWRIAFINRAAELLLGDRSDALLGQPFGEPLDAGQRSEVELQSAQGARSAELTALQVPWDDKPATLVILRDVSDLKRAMVALRDSEERFRAAFADAGIAMALVATGEPGDGRLEQVNAAMISLTGRDEATLLNTTIDALTHPEDVSAARDDVALLLRGDIPLLSVEQRILNARGEEIWVHDTSSLVRDASGDPTHRVVQLQDISARKRVERRLQYLADHDPLTGLFNRRRLAGELARELSRATRYATGGALLLIDLDNFKDVNDTLGHAAGDELLMSIARRLGDRLRATDIVARLGGDEFAVILPQTDETRALAVADDIATMLSGEPSITTPSGAQSTGASIGVAHFSDITTMTADDLLLQADLAMYEAKQAGRGRVARFDLNSDEINRRRTRASWSARLRRALQTDRFVLHRQPIVAIDGLVPVQDELLLRIVGDDGELTPAGAFIHVAERHDLVQEIDRWVVEHAIEALSLARRTEPELCFAINLSAKSLADDRMIDLLEASLGAGGLAPGALTVELTETAAVANMDTARRFATRLRALGCNLALDDFGSGFASFAYLKHLDFDCVKIDGELITGLQHDHTSQLLVAAIVAIARGLGKQTTAEHVEQLQTLRYLRDAGVDHAQGFAIAEPSSTGSSGRDIDGWRLTLSGA